VKQIDDLISGFARFRAAYFEKNRELFDGLKHGQNPRFMVIACSDSRTDPAIIFDAAPGDLFVIRNVANLVPPYANDAALHGISSALEFGVRVLKVRHIIVLGHAQCAGIRALVTGSSGEFVSRWVKIAEPARQRIMQTMPGATTDQYAQACEKEAIAVSLDNLLTFPWIRDRVEAQTLFLHGWHFDLDSGSLSHFDQVNREFTDFATK
jgi:carbonic anhydrase